MTEETQQKPLDAHPLAQDMPACPGRMLHEARVAMGLTVEDVAAQLCLKVELLSALEQDDYDKLPPPTFVGGYLRNYARLLGLPENDIIERYTRCAGEHSPSLIAATRLQKQAKASDLPIRIVTYLLVFGLGVMLLVWWMTQGEEMRALLPEEVTTIEPGMDIVAEDNISVEPRSEQNVEQGIEDAESVSVETISSIQHREDLVNEPAAGTTAVIDNADTEPLQKNIESVPADQSPEELSEPPVPPLTLDMPQTEVMLEFSQQSWVEISDSAGRRLIYELVPANKMLVLQGEAPFEVFLGNAQGVQVYYQKISFNHTPYHRGDLAKFRLGQRSDNKLLNDYAEE